jgi:hypothetical protein
MRVVLALFAITVLLFAGCIGETQTKQMNDSTGNNTNQTLNISKPPEPKLTEIHLNVPHNLQKTQPACIYLAIYNILSYYNDSISLDDFFGISGYYSSIVEEYYGIGWEKYHGKLYMIGGNVLPELGYLSYNQRLRFEKGADNGALILSALNNRTPLLFLPIHENLWYLDAVRAKKDNSNPTINDFEALNALVKPFFGHAVVITGYKYVGEDVFLEISDSGYESEQGPYYYLNLTNYFDFLDYVRKNQVRRTSYEDPLIENTLMYKVIKDPGNRFKLSEPDRSLHILYRTIESARISASHLEGKTFNENTGQRAAIAACSLVELMPKLADTLDSQVSIEDPKLEQAKLMLNETPQLLGICSELQDLAIQDPDKLNARIQNITNRVHDITRLLSDIVHEYGDEIKIEKENQRITITVMPKVENIYGTDIRLGRGSFATNITLSNIEISSGTYEVVYKNQGILKISGASYPLTVSFDVDSGEEFPLSLIVESYPNLKGQGIYEDSEYWEIFAEVIDVD